MKVTVWRERAVPLLFRSLRGRDGRSAQDGQDGQDGQSASTNGDFPGPEHVGQSDRDPGAERLDSYYRPEGDRPGHPAVRPRPEPAGATDRRARGPAVPRASAVPVARELDYRRRGLRSEAMDDAEPADVPAPPERADHRAQHRLAPLLVKAAVLVAVAAVAVLLLRAFVVQPFAVPGDAMTPTLQGGDRILVLRAGLEGSIHSGEIVVFHPRQSLPCAVAGGRDGDLVLRVVALPGEVIQSVGETILLDGRPLRERGWYDPSSGQVGSAPIRDTTVARGQYFVLADNRSDACDSRVFGPISRSSIVGTGIAIVGRSGHLFFATL